MSSQYSWQQKDQLIYARLSGTVDAQDLRKGNANISHYLEDSKSASVHLLFDCREVERITFSVVQVRNELRYLQHPALGWVVIFGMSGVVENMVEFLTAVISRLSGLRVYSADTLEDGVSFLQSVDPSLPAVLPSIDASA